MTSADDDILIAASTMMLTCTAMEVDNEIWQRRRKKRKVWVKPWLVLREKMGAYQALVVEFANTEHDDY